MYTMEHPFALGTHFHTAAQPVGAKGLGHFLNKFFRTTCKVELPFYTVGTTVGIFLHSPPRVMYKCSEEK